VQKKEENNDNKIGIERKKQKSEYISTIFEINKKITQYY
jgi:hypothetical protein